MIHFDIDWRDLNTIGNELGATEKQVKFALSYALRRTVSRLRTLSTRGLRDELALRRVSDLRNRLKSIRLRKGKGEGAQLWYGLNDMPVSWFKGTPKQGSDGAQFRNQEFPGAFVARSRFKNQKTVLKRAGKARLKIIEQLMPVEDKAHVYIEDNIFVQVEDIFWPLFKREIQARVKYKIGEA
jgi:hypothetical protein